MDLLRVWIHVYTQPRYFVTWVEQQDDWPNNQGEATEENIERECASFSDRPGFRAQIIQHETLDKETDGRNWYEYQNLCKRFKNRSLYRVMSQAVTPPLISLVPRSKKARRRRAS